MCSNSNPPHTLWCDWWALTWVWLLPTYSPPSFYAMLKDEVIHCVIKCLHWPLFKSWIPSTCFQCIKKNMTIQELPLQRTYTFSKRIMLCFCIARVSFISVCTKTWTKYLLIQEYIQPKFSTIANKKVWWPKWDKLHSQIYRRWLITSLSYDFL